MTAFRTLPAANACFKCSLERNGLKKMFAHNPHDLKPCRHMTGLVSALADDSLTGIPRWFTTQHVAGCPHCRNGLEYFQALNTRLKALEIEGETLLNPEQWAAAEMAWEKVDGNQGTAARE